MILTKVFKHHERNRFTRMSPDRNTKKQIDFVAIDMRWFSSILDVEAYLEAGGDSDHNQMIYLN